MPIYTNIFVAERLLQAEHGRPEYSSAGLDEIYKKKNQPKQTKERESQGGRVGGKHLFLKANDRLENRQ